MTGAVREKARVYAGKATELSPGAPILLRHGKREIGVFLLPDGGIAALTNRCPHRGGQLCEGPVCGTTAATVPGDHAYAYERAGELVRCAWHGWEFDIRTGQCLADPGLKAKTYPVIQDGDDLYVEVAG